MPSACTPTTWRRLINDEMRRRGDCWDGAIVIFGRDLRDEQHTDVDLTDVDACLDREFYADEYGAADGLYFTLWTNDRVYFPVLYEGGTEGAASVPRNPVTEASEHKGDG